MRKIKLLLGIILVGVVVLAYFNYPKLNLISGYAAKNMASSVYVAGRNTEDVQFYDHDMPLIKLANATVSDQEHTASAKVYGLMERTAFYKEGLGAVLTNKEYSQHAFNTVPHRKTKKDTLPFPYGNNGLTDTLLPNVDYDQVEIALNNAFQHPEEKTRTLLVVYKDQIIGERYINGITEDTPILGWSMTKSVLATLYGILQYQGQIDVTAPAPIKEWQNDGRKAITINNLLRMQSGLAWEEDYFKISDVTKMLFLDSDMTLAQRKNEMIAPPGEIWNYSSGTSNLLSGILRNQLGSHQTYLDFPYKELIDRIGMHSMLLETDLEGNYVGSSYAWATTRDWAKFGLLYLHNGNWNGDQLFSKEWVDYITTPTQNSDGKYGGHFWLNAGGIFPNIPTNVYSANGFQGQRVFIIPSKDMVVVRTGLEEQTDEQYNTLLSEILLAIQ
ncbi:CubicO group peptidase, beta-lactamase class C family [Maribacter sedimenticola]|uniref:CubicO group peptidase, beta-lactamase class C family n=1 Tax=Maribacter sedimenticola TaxID=228956 RepID=A0ABY1SGR8_9FLAO|nr:serine hydrolase [Maribacter sedimenticola]SNR46968.1 CubicO group peptidase, beta-lactamase class C family [Maribacter sedimenticola]